ncbi:hypothetical protein GXW82_35440 [Streptacidiphilus sp. 4-A2]|nr:hypothetical protein [Streptacidiphilus sp. 4-A2]
MALPIETSKFTGIFCAVAPAVRLANRETGQPRIDRDTGLTMYQVGVCLMAGSQAEVINVTVAGEPKGVVQGVPVQVRDLAAVPWENEGRHGIAFRASAITPLTPPAAPPAKGGAQ